MRLVRLVGRVALVLMLLTPVWSRAALASEAWAMDVQQPQPPSGFVPVDEVPPGEQIPAINMVAAAYGLVWVALLGYVWSLARRLKAVESELSQLETRKR